jgi:hypothetical protein
MSYPTQTLETLLWSSSVTTNESGDYQSANQFEPSQELRDYVGDKFAQFEAKLHEQLPDFDIVDDCKIECDEFEQLEHDFILTVNGHGAGFWDGDWQSGDVLTKICHDYFSELEIYLADDGLLYPA